MPTDKAVWAARSAVSAVINKRLRSAGIHTAPDTVSPCGSGVMLFVDYPAGHPGYAAIRAAADFPGCEIDEKLGIIHWVY